MTSSLPFKSWNDLSSAQRSEFFRGKTSDYLFDQSRNAYLTPSGEGLFTQSNARILLGQAANGSLRFVAIPTRVYPAPTGMSEFGLGPGMYHHFDVAMYAGDLSYRLELDGEDQPIDLASEDLANETFYANHFLPVTVSPAREDLEIRLVSLAPVTPDSRSAPLAPAPLPGPSAALYVLHLRSRSDKRITGRVVLQAGDLLVGHYEDADPALREVNRPAVSIRQNTLILTRPEGSVGVHLHQGKWTQTAAPFSCERSFTLEPGQDVVFETYIAIGGSHGEVMPAIYELYRRSALDWLNLTAAFWRSRLGNLEVSSQDAGEIARISRDVYIRCLLDNFNCLQADPQGRLLAHWQGAPSHGYGTVWGIDVEPTAASIVHILPEMTRAAMLFFMTRSRAPRGPVDHSVPILVAPVILARQWLQVTGDAAFLQAHPEILENLQSIMDELESIKAPGEALFPTRFSSDGPVGRRYDYGTNVKVYYTFESMAYIMRLLGRDEQAARFMAAARSIREAIARNMLVDGPFGRQISGGTNLGEDPAGFYLPEDILYYDGEDTSSMLAPVYGACDFDDEGWVNYHRFARSLWCHHYDPEFDTLRWSPSEPAVVDGTALFSRLAGAVTQKEMVEAFHTLQAVGLDEVTGSVFWWPHGRQYKRSLTRCSQGQGAWAMHYLYQWLGLRADAAERRLVLAPRGLLEKVGWKGFRAGAGIFDIDWDESTGGASARVKNNNDVPWMVQVGFRQPGAGACGPLSWQMCALGPGEETTFFYQGPAATVHDVDLEAVVKLETGLLGEEGILFRRFGPALLWGHWDLRQAWDMRALPLSLRFVIANDTGSEWRGVTVDLHVPENWQAQGRQPMDWPQPDRMAGGCVRLDLGDLPSGRRAAAPFWVKGPQAYTLTRMWDDIRPFHLPSQPGNEVNLWIAGIQEADEVTFKAVLRAAAGGGKEVIRELVVPVKIHPAEGPG